MNVWNTTVPVFAFVEEKERTHAGVGVGRASISRK